MPVILQYSLICIPLLEITFFLNGTFHANNTIIDVNDIGNSNYEALLCLTNVTNCCGNNYGNQGEWYFLMDCQPMVVLTCTLAETEVAVCYVLY